MEFVILVEERQDEDSKQRAGTHQHNHQKTITIRCEGGRGREREREICYGPSCSKNGIDSDAYIHVAIVKRFCKCRLNFIIPLAGSVLVLGGSAPPSISSQAEVLPRQQGVVTLRLMSSSWTKS